MRKLRKSIEIALSIIAMLLFLFIAMVNDFNLIGGIIWLGAAVLLIIIIKILKKYGRGVMYEHTRKMD